MGLRFYSFFSFRLRYLRSTSAWGPAAELVLLSGELDALGVLKSPMVITSLKNIIDNLYHHSLFEQCGSCTSKYDTKPSLMVIGSNPSFRYVNFLNFLKKIPKHFGNDYNKSSILLILIIIKGIRQNI